MKAFCLHILLVITVCFGHKIQNFEVNHISEFQAYSLIYEGLGKTYYFPDALIYEYEIDGEKAELWIYVNPKTKQLLYVPNDEMISAVISFPNGTYKIFGKTEKGKDTVLIQRYPEIAEEYLAWEGLKPLAEIRTISQQNIQQPTISSRGYRFDYEQMEGGENIYATSEIPINSHQLYGFCKLDGDAKLNIYLDYSSILSKDQLITHVERNNFSVELLNYGPNPYYFTSKIN